MSAPCSSLTFSNLTVPGIDITAIIASPISNFSAYVHEGYWPNHATMNVTNVNFCNLTITYNHPGWNDTLNNRLYLPTDTWNGRLQGLGGDGLSAGLDDYVLTGMAGAVSQGYLCTTTDGGHTSNLNVAPWALTSPGNIDLYTLEDLGSVSLKEMTIIAKDVGEIFYGRRPDYSYFSGCSQGGRQGHMLAQRYPDQYDGIAASAPAMYWSQFIIAAYWPQFVMNQMQAYPKNCELEAITNAAIAACDANDGVVDGILVEPETCTFDPYSVIGTSIANCSDTNSPATISETAAKVALAAWTGPKDLDGSSLWFGVNKDAALVGDIGTASTVCSKNGTCTGSTGYLFSQWISYFVKKDPFYDINTMTHEDYVQIFKSSTTEYRSNIGTEELDLTEFSRLGKKMISYHGLADPLIQPRGQSYYYEQVMARQSNIHDFYRLFEAPGLGHCYGGNGFYPSTIFEELVNWVENGQVPDRLLAKPAATATGQTGKRRILCPYPQYAKYDGTGNQNSSESYQCVDRLNISVPIYHV